MKRSTTLTALMFCSGIFMGTGCVSQQGYDDLASINRQLEETNSRLEKKIAERDQTVTGLQAALKGMKNQSATIAALRKRLAEEQATIDVLRQKTKALQGELKALGEATPDVIVVEGLPQEVSDALRDLAGANPDLMTYDPARGMIRLRSDLTFALGSANVSKTAQTALSRLAGVLNSSAASGFGIQVIGHTDAVPVKSAQGKKIFIDNRGLSSNRGDAVARVLIRDGVAASRITSGGRGATQPIAPNDARGRSKANRRVDIFLVKDTEPAPPREHGSSGLPTNTGSSNTHTGTPVQSGVSEGQPEVEDDTVFK